MPIKMEPTLQPQGINPDGTRSISRPVNIEPPTNSSRNPTELAQSLQGYLANTDAVMQETKKTMRDMGVLAQRMTQMLGGTATAGGSPTNILPPVSHRGEGTLALASHNALTGASYGTGLGLTVYPAAHAQVIAAPNTSVLVPGSGQAHQSFTQAGQAPTIQVPGGPLPSTSSTAPGQQGSQPQTIVPPSGLPPAPDDVTPQLPPPGTQGREVAELAAAGSLDEGVKRGSSVQGIAKEVAGRLKNYNGPGARLLFGRDEAGKLVNPNDAGIIGGIASGDEGVTSAVSGGVLGDGIAGPVGLIAGGLDALYHFGGDWLSSQRAQNATFQSVEGGSNIGALAERGRQMAFEGSQFGVFTSKQADQIFQGVTNMGLQGGARQAGLNFVSNNYKQMGMSPQESIDLLNTATQTGVTSLTQLSEVLQEVTSSAAAASVNTDQARQNFAAMFTDFTNAGISGNAASNVAGATQTSINSLGKAGEGIKLPSQNQTSMSIQAALMGFNTTGAYQAAIDNGKSGQILLAKARAAQLGTLTGDLTNNASGAMAIFRSEAEKNHGKLTQAEMSNSSLGMRDLYKETGLDADQLREYLKSIGVSPGKEEGALFGGIATGTLTTGPVTQLEKEQAQELADAKTAKNNKKRTFAREVTGPGAAGTDIPRDKHGKPEFKTVIHSEQQYNKDHEAQLRREGNMYSTPPAERIVHTASKKTNKHDTSKDNVGKDKPKGSGLSSSDIRILVDFTPWAKNVLTVAGQQIPSTALQTMPPYPTTSPFKTNKHG
jgi:hypothetical protein